MKILIIMKWNDSSNDNNNVKNYPAIERKKENESSNMKRESVANNENNSWKI